MIEMEILIQILIRMFSGDLYETVETVFPQNFHTRKLGEIMVFYVGYWKNRYNNEKQQSDNNYYVWLFCIKLSNGTKSFDAT